MPELGACVFCPPCSGVGAGDDCAPQAGQSAAIRRRPVRRRLVGAQLLSRTKQNGGRKEEKGKKKERKKAQTAVTDRLSERSGAQAARRQAGLPLRLGPSGRARRGGGPAAARYLCPETGRGAESGEERLLSLGGMRARVLRRSRGRAPPHRPLHNAGTAFPSPQAKLSNKARFPLPTCPTVTAQ